MSAAVHTAQTMAFSVLEWNTIEFQHQDKDGQLHGPWFLGELVRHAANNLIQPASLLRVVGSYWTRWMYMEAWLPNCQKDPARLHRSMFAPPASLWSWTLYMPTGQVICAVPSFKLARWMTESHPSMACVPGRPTHLSSMYMSELQLIAMSVQQNATQSIDISRLVSDQRAVNLASHSWPMSPLTEVSKALTAAAEFQNHSNSAVAASNCTLMTASDCIETRLRSAQGRSSACANSRSSSSSSESVSIPDHLFPELSANSNSSGTSGTTCSTLLHFSSSGNSSGNSEAHHLVSKAVDDALKTCRAAAQAPYVVGTSTSPGKGRAHITPLSARTAGDQGVYGTRLLTAESLKTQAQAAVLSAITQMHSQSVTQTAEPLRVNLARSSMESDSSNSGSPGSASSSPAFYADVELSSPLDHATEPVPLISQSSSMTKSAAVAPCVLAPVCVSPIASNAAVDLSGLNQTLWTDCAVQPSSQLAAPSPSSPPPATAEAAAAAPPPPAAPAAAAISLFSEDYPFTTRYDSARAVPGWGRCLSLDLMWETPFSMSKGSEESVEFEDGAESVFYLPGDLDLD